MFKEIEYLTSFRQVFQGLTEEESNRPALVCDGISYSYRELDQAADLCASDLIAAGVQPGDHVGIWSFNNTGYIVNFLGIIRAGAVAVLGNYSMTLDEIADLFDMTDISSLVYGTVLISKKDPVCAEHLAEQLHIDPAKLFNLNDKSCDYKQRLLAGEKPADMEELKRRADAETPRQNAYIIFTTGTTSKPKAVLDHQEGLLFTTGRHHELRKSRMGMSVCIALPLFHIFGLFAMFSYFQNKATVYLESRVGAEAMVRELKAHPDLADLATVTKVYLDLIAHKEFPAVESQVRLLTTAGGSLTPAQFTRMELSFSNAILFNEYGQTESHGCITFCETDAPLEKRAFTLGRPYTDSELIIYDTQKGIRPVWDVGEIRLRTPALMNGYYKLPEEKQAIDSEGWMHTGDLGVIDNAGYLRMAGRAKDIIIKNGENISPLEIETAISDLPEVKQVKVFGAPHPIFGEDVECCLVPADGVELDTDHITEVLRKSLSSVKIPSYYFIFPEFPLAPSGKMDQKGLRAMMLRKLARIILHDELELGKVIMELTIKNTIYNITPVSRMVEALAESIYFGPRRRKRIALAVEEFLTERIVNAYGDVGEIKIRCIFRRDWLSIEFSDSGEEYKISKDKESSTCAKLILGLADNFSVHKQKNSPPLYLMDFLYEQSFDIEEYLLAHEISRD